MGLLDQLNHLVNFLATALAVGLLLAVVGPLIHRKSPAALGFLVQAAINSVAGAVALGLGLWFFGRDGKMASYCALLVVAASSQWLGARAWR